MDTKKLQQNLQDNPIEVQVPPSPESERGTGGEAQKLPKKLEFMKDFGPMEAWGIAGIAILVLFLLFAIFVGVVVKLSLHSLGLDQ
ncbi:MAG: hypothetical protein ABH835_01380 [Patescibacteria group bacterium]